MASLLQFGFPDLEHVKSVTLKHFSLTHHNGCALLHSFSNQDEQLNDENFAWNAD